MRLLNTIDERLRTLSFVVAAIAVLSLIGMSVVFALIRTDLGIARSEANKVDHYLNLSNRINSLYLSIAENAKTEGGIDSGDLTELRKQIVDILLQLQSEIEFERVEALGLDTARDSPNEDIHSGNTALRDIASQIEDALSDLERAQAFSLAGRDADAGRTLRQALESGIAAQLAPEIAQAVTRERLGVRLHASRVQQWMQLVHVGVIGLAIATGLAALGIWFWVGRPHRRAVEAVGGSIEALRKGGKVERLELAGGAEYGRLLSNLATAAEERDRAMKQAAERLAELEGQARSLHDEQVSLQRVDRVRREFLADVSHELRTPLTVMRGVAEVALRSRSETVEELRTALQRIVDESTHVDRIVDDLFFIARSRAGGMDLRTDIVDADSLLQATRHDAEALAARVEGTLHWLVPELRVEVEGDRGRLRQLFAILLDNAFKYGGRRPAVDVVARVSDGKLIVEVRDHGAGVMADELTHVFERLYRGRTSARTTPEGAGLGLAMARSIVEAHRGEIGLTNAADGGALARVSLPVFDPDAPEGELEASPEEAP